MEWYPEPIPPSLLALFYSDIPKHAFSFQSIIIRERVHVDNQAIKFLKDGNFSIVDRSPYGDCAFALMHYASGNISLQQLMVYKELINFGTNSGGTKVTTESSRDRVQVTKNSGGTIVTTESKGTKEIKEIVVYLSCNPEKARERLSTRSGNSDESTNCDVEYLIKLDSSYMKVFGFEPASSIEKTVIQEVRPDDSVNIIIIDYDEDFPVDSDGCMDKNNTFEILHRIVSRIK